ncbi:hypothetical protein ACT01T_17090 [Enterobacter asburiae]|uniref:hypothetical protein n=1 Tax=Enterobacter cloacae complex TaxID=354276 RepID=UPI0007387D37|nr:hypothetical protein [Enterobacter asburiae]MBT2099798.1 hypothetical protein [Enterobacter asburiae]
MKINLSEEDFRPLDIYEQWAELRRSEANSLYEDLYSSIFMSHVNEINYQKLTTTLHKYESFDIVYRHLIGEKVPKDQFIMITGLFINYIASAISLRDSTRNIYNNKKLFPEKLKQLAESKLHKEIIANTNIKLVEDIRNIITHQSLIVPVLSFAVTEGRTESGYSYMTKQLLNYKRLTATSREHLLQIKHGNLYLKPLIDDYHQTTASYQNWLICESLEKHKCEYPIYWTVRNQISSEWDGDLEPSFISLLSN